jgi:6-phosphogluconolactonase
MTSPTNLRLESLPDADALALRVADWLQAAATAGKGRFAIALSGGSTPKRLYERLAAPPYRDAMPWSRIHWFWGDERFVPPDHPQSNYRMVRDAMLSRAPIDPANVHAIPTVGVDAEDAAATYEYELQSFYGADRLDPQRPLFDVTLLGLGPDGHTASLFPGAAALGEGESWALGVVDSQGLPRITLTLPVLNSSRTVAFLVEGEGKKSIVERFRRGDRDLPATRVRPVGTRWLFGDRAAIGADGA